MGRNGTVYIVDTANHRVLAVASGGYAATVAGNGTAGLGGVVVPQGSQMYLVNGTDATAVCDYALNYQIQPLAQVAA